MKINTTLLLVASVLLLAGSVSCKKKTFSEKTGWKYNDAEWGGFQKYKKVKQATGPGLIVIEGGTFVLGNMEADLTHLNDAASRRVTVNTFYMDETEVTNSHWLEYLYWLGRVYKSYPE